MSYHCLYRVWKKSYNSIHYINIERNTRRKLKNKVETVDIFTKEKNKLSVKSKGKRTEHLNKSKKKIVS